MSKSNIFQLLLTALCTGCTVITILDGTRIILAGAITVVTVIAFGFFLHGIIHEK